MKRLRRYVSSLLPPFVASDQLLPRAKRRLAHFEAITDEVGLVDYLLASASIPYVFPPVRINGDLYVDGGVGNHTPTREAALLLRRIESTEPGIAGDTYCVSHDPPDMADLRSTLSSARVLLRTIDVFHYVHQTPILQACPRYDQSASFRAAYQEFTTAWLDRGRSGLMAGDQRSLTATLDQWQAAMRGWGRRGRQPLGKEVLDVLSYECRAAFHRRYTVVWQDLSFYLASHWGLDEPSQRFIQLWHLDRSSPTDDTAIDFHLFHGHVFGLHPGSGLVMQTPTGRTLIADFIRARTAEEQVEPFRRILAAIELAVHIYIGGRSGYAESRWKRPGTSCTRLDVRTSSWSPRRSHRIASDRSCR